MHREEYTNKCQFRDLSQSKHPYKYKQHPDQEIQILSNISKLSLCPLPDPSPRKKNHHAANRYRFITWLSFHSIFFVRDIQIVAHSNFSFSFLKISPLNTISFYPTYTLCLETVWYIFFSSFPCNLFVFFKKAPPFWSDSRKPQSAQSIPPLRVCPSPTAPSPWALVT